MAYPPPPPSAAPLPSPPTGLHAHTLALAPVVCQLEHKYQHDLEEARRGAEALASQCAAQSSLIGTLKREVAQGAVVLADQKAVVQRVEQKAAADLELSQCDIKHLHGRIQELTAEKATLVVHIESQATAIADLKAAAAAAVAEAQAAEHARARALDSYARQMLATRLLVSRWRRELGEKRAAVASFEVVRAAAARPPPSSSASPFPRAATPLLLCDFFSPTHTQTTPTGARGQGGRGEAGGARGGGGRQGARRRRGGGGGAGRFAGGGG